MGEVTIGIDVWQDLQMPPVTIWTQPVPFSPDAKIIRPDGTIVFRPALDGQEEHPTESWLIIESSDRFRFELRQLDEDGVWRERWRAIFDRTEDQSSGNDSPS